MQTITAPTSHINHRLFAVLVATALFAVIVTLAVVHYVQGSSTRAILPAPARLAPLGSSRSTPFEFSNCAIHRPC
jgi:hypothetical protein